jgi:hypothetical protein
MDLYKPLSPYIEHVLRCARTGRDPNPDAKRYERMEFWDEDLRSHSRNTEAALSMYKSQETETRQADQERTEIEVNKEINPTHKEKEE